MNVFILTDLEGIAGIDDFLQSDKSFVDVYVNSCKFLANSINLAVDTCFKNGADAVYYIDSYEGGGNVTPDMIDKRAVNCSISEWEELVREKKIDCVIELGSHARAGTIGGFLDHTRSSTEIFCTRLNGIEQSELSLHALFCAQYGIPTVAVIGDVIACEQAKEYIPDIYTGAVKLASERNHAKTFENADEILINTISEALKNYKNVSFYKISLPSVTETVYYRTDMCEEWMNYRPDAERINARTLRKNVTKITCFKDIVI